MKLAQSFVRRGAPLARWSLGSTINTKTSFPSKLLMASGLKRFQAVAARSFASESQSTLIDILSREEQEEIDTGNLQMPAELADLKSSLENDWKIVENEGSTSLFLKDSKVQISFHCQDTVEEVDEEGYAVEDAEEPTDPVRFCVTVSKAGKTLVMNCLSEYGQVKIEGVATSLSSADAIHANQGNAPEKAHYQGPDFVELAEDLQEAFVAYLEDECCVNSDVSTFIAMYTDSREQTLYAQFLKDAQAIIS